MNVRYLLEVELKATKHIYLSIDQVPICYYILVIGYCL